MPSPEEIRQAFEAFLGKEKFEKFVASGFTPRLRFWQEAEWSKFVVANPTFNAPLVELEVALRICELHRVTLLPGTVAIFHGNIDFSHDYLRVRERLFPHAAEDLKSTEGVPSKETRAEVWYCHRCREVRAQWSARRASEETPPRAK